MFALGIFAACSPSGSGGTTGAPATVAGQWMVWITFNSQEVGPFATCFTQTGSTISGVGLSGTVTGNSFTVTNDDLGGLAVQFRGTMSGSQGAGTVTITGNPASGTFRMQPFTPTGDLVLTGSVSGVSTEVNTTAASGRREFSDMLLTQLTDVEAAFDDGLVRAHLTFSAGGLAVGAHSVGSGGITTTLSFETTGAAADQTATGGSLTLTRYDTNGMAGTYSLTFSGGGSASGSFDVAWDLNAFVP